MEELTDVNFKLKFKDTFVLNSLYNALYTYFTQKGYADEDEDFGEIYYFMDKGGNGKRDIKIWWRFDGYDGVNDFFKYEIDVNFKCVQLGEGEIEKDGESYDVDVGEIEIEFKSKLYMDAKDQWQKNFITKLLYERFWKRYYYNDQIGSMAGDFEGDMEKVQSLIKGFFGIGSPPPMVPVRGIGF
ncbi:MAG: hypothetical protein ACOCRX_00525 [Candidatus Woesearchaeota archaeon]